jgi:NAD(P)H-flavin reductase
VQYSELSTPLTVEHYTSHPQGCFYGLPGTPTRYRAAALAARSPVGGLYLSGSDVASLGIVGAMMGGVAAASKVLGQAGFFRIVSHVSRSKPLSLAGARPAEKQRAVLVTKAALTPWIWRLEFELDQPVQFVPGQYAKVRVAPFEWRDYSIAAASGKRVAFLISNRTHGYGSSFADSVQPGEATEIELPLGSYRLLRNTNRKVFVATGTGLAPFLPMFEEMVKAGELDAAELYFGCRTLAENITEAFAAVPRTTVCVSRGQAPPGGFQGRVTQALASFRFDPQATDFYICGSAAMVADCRTILERAGAARILIEPY